MAKSGWMKLHRRFLDWEWFGCAEMVQLFTWLLLSASDKDVHYRGVALRRGQVLVSQRNLAKRLHMSHKQMRVCISRLQMTGEITTQTAHLYTIVTICNYDVYQASANGEGHSKGTVRAQQTAQQTAQYKSSVTSGKPMFYEEESEAKGTVNGTPSKQKAAHIIKNKEYIVVDVDARTRTREEAIRRLRQEVFSSQLKIESALRATRVATKEQLFEMCEQIFADWAMTDRGTVDWAHLRNQLLIKAEAQRREAAKLASLPKPKQDLKDWKKDFAAGMLRTARQRLAEDELNGAQKN